MTEIDGKYLTMALKTIKKANREFYAHPVNNRKRMDQLTYEELVMVTQDLRDYADLRLTQDAEREQAYILPMASKLVDIVEDCIVPLGMSYQRRKAFAIAEVAKVLREYADVFGEEKKDV